MGESYIQLPEDSTGKKIRSRVRTIGANEVHEEYALLGSERVLGGLYSVASFRTSLALTGLNLFTLMNDYAVIRESYTVGDNTQANPYGNYWWSQTFTPSVAHKILRVRLKLFREGSSGTVTVSIRATDENGHPTGGDLCSGSMDGSIITTSSPGAWYEIALGAGYNLSASTKYAIIVRTSFAYLYWRVSSSGAYAGGNREGSTDGGSSWTAYADNDFMFEEWGQSPTASTHIAVRKLSVVMDWVAASSSVAPTINLSCPIYAPSAGTILTAVKRAASYGSSIATVRGAVATDGGTSTAILATGGSNIERQFIMRLHTAVGQVLPSELSLISSREEKEDFILGVNEGLLVNIPGSTTQDMHFIVNCLWEEFTLP